eukprot:Skav216849  [mRNA]  locus=scaffold1042:12886:14512:- [translate_table: standard]
MDVIHSATSAHDHTAGPPGSKSNWLRDDAPSTLRTASTPSAPGSRETSRSTSTSKQHATVSQRRRPWPCPSQTHRCGQSGALESAISTFFGI